MQTGDKTVVYKAFFAESSEKLWNYDSENWEKFGNSLRIFLEVD